MTGEGMFVISNTLTYAGLGPFEEKVGSEGLSAD